MRRFLILPVLVTLGAAVGLLFDQDISNLPNALNKSDNLGKVIDVNNDVRLKNNTTLAWRVLKPGTPISEGDSLFSGEDSIAKVELVGKGSVTVNPWSLIIFNNIAQNQTPTIKINYGEVSIEPKADKNWIVEAKGEKIRFAAKREKSVLRLSANRKLTAASENGDFEIESNGSKKVLPAFSKQSFNSNKTEKYLPRELMAPEMETVQATPAPQEIKPALEVLSIQKTEPPPIKEKPKKPITIEKIQTPKPKPVSMIEKKEPELPPVAPVKKISLQTPQLFSPVDGITAFFPNKTTGALKFSWSTIPHATQYTIETSFSNSFDGVLWSATVKTNQVQHFFNVAQKIYWRVKALGSENNESEWSRTNTVSIGTANEK